MALNIRLAVTKVIFVYRCQSALKKRVCSASHFDPLVTRRRFHSQSLFVRISKTGSHRPLLSKRIESDEPHDVQVDQGLPSFVFRAKPDQIRPGPDQVSTMA